MGLYTFNQNSDSIEVWCSDEKYGIQIYDDDHNGDTFYFDSKEQFEKFVKQCQSLIKEESK